MPQKPRRISKIDDNLLQMASNRLMNIHQDIRLSDGTVSKTTTNRQKLNDPGLKAGHRPANHAAVLRS